MATFKVIQLSQPNVDIKMPSVRIVQEIRMGSHNTTEKFYRSVISENTINFYTDRKFIFSLQHIFLWAEGKAIGCGRITKV
jgi:hypothetical protein